MSENPKVSVIIPVYNVEKYLRQCLDSVVNQTLREIEIICVNDGSTDGSGEILREYRARDPRIVIIDKKNSGYGDSMNRGIERAAAKWLGIVESDDWAEPDMFERLYDIAEKNDVDFVRCLFFNELDGKQDVPEWRLGDAPVGEVCNPHDLCLKNTNTLAAMVPPWNALYRKSFLDENNVRFLPTPGASYQDTGWGLKAFSTGKRAIFTKTPLYHYRLDNPDASSNNYDKKWQAIFGEHRECERFLREKNLLDLMPFEQFRKFIDFRNQFLNFKSDEVKQKFLEKMSGEFSDAAKSGFLDKKLFWTDDLIDIEILTERPEFYPFYKMNVEPLLWTKKWREVEEIKNLKASRAEKSAHLAKKFFKSLRENGLKKTLAKLKKYFAKRGEK